MKVHCLFYGHLRDIVKQRQIDIETDDITEASLGSIHEWLLTKYPEFHKFFTDKLLPKPEIIILVNEKDAMTALQGLNTKITCDTMIIFIPTVHGG